MQKQLVHRGPLWCRLAPRTQPSSLRCALQIGPSTPLPTASFIPNSPPLLSHSRPLLPAREPAKQTWHLSDATMIWEKSSVQTGGPSARFSSKRRWFLLSELPSGEAMATSSLLRPFRFISPPGYATRGQELAFPIWGPSLCTTAPTGPSPSQALKSSVNSEWDGQ